MTDLWYMIKVMIFYVLRPLNVPKFTEKFLLKFHNFLLGPLRISFFHFLVCMCASSLHTGQAA